MPCAAAGTQNTLAAARPARLRTDTRALRQGRAVIVRAAVGDGGGGVTVVGHVVRGDVT